MQERATEGNGNNSCTKDCTRYTGTLCGRKINLIDTPGFNDTHGLSDETIMAQILAEVCLKTESKTVDAFLITDSLKADKSYSEKVITVIKKCFGDDAARKVIVIMTKGETSIVDDDEVEAIDTRVGFIKDLLKKHKGGSAVYWTNSLEPARNGKAGKGVKIHGLKKPEDGKLLLQIQRAHLWAEIKATGDPMRSPVEYIAVYRELETSIRKALGFEETYLTYTGPACNYTYHKETWKWAEREDHYALRQVSKVTTFGVLALTNDHWYKKTIPAKTDYHETKENCNVQADGVECFTVNKIDGDGSVSSGTLTNGRLSF